MPLRYGNFRDSARLLLISSLLFLVGCGPVRIAGVLNSSNVSVASGTVSFVQFTVIFDSKGMLTEATIVTLLMPVGTNTFTFCGNQVSQFTMNSSVQISFTPAGQACSNLIAVVQH